MELQPGFQFEIFWDHAETSQQEDWFRKKTCGLLIDEISLKENLTYSESQDKLIRLENFGFVGQTSKTANTTLVFMVGSLRQLEATPLLFFSKECYLCQQFVNISERIESSRVKD